MEARLEMEILRQIAAGSLETVKAVGNIDPSLLVKNNDACIEAVIRRIKPQSADILLYLLQKGVWPKPENQLACFDIFYENEMLCDIGYETSLGANPTPATMYYAMNMMVKQSNIHLLLWIVDKYHDFIFPEAEYSGQFADMHQDLIEYALIVNRDAIFDAIAKHAKKPTLRYLLHRIVDYMTNLSNYINVEICREIIARNLLDKSDYVETLRLAVLKDNIEMVRILLECLQDVDISKVITT